MEDTCKLKSNVLPYKKCTYHKANNIFSCPLGSLDIFWVRERVPWKQVLGDTCSVAISNYCTAPSPSPFMYRLKPSLLFPFLCRISSSDLLLEFMYMYKADKDLQQYSFSEFVNLATIPMIPMVTLHKR